VVGGLAEQRLGAGAGEGLGEVPGDDTADVDRDRHGPETRRPRGGQGSGVGRRFDQERGAGGHEGAERR
jgi:hypothetical protein